MKKNLINIIKIVSFFIIWGVSVSIPINFCDNISFIADNPAFLRLYWELAPLVMTIIITLIYMKLIEKNRKMIIDISERPIVHTTLGIILGVIWIMLVAGISIKLNILNLGNANKISYIWIWVLAILLNVAMQEIMVRGYMFSLLRREYNPIVSIVGTTIIFTLMHGGAFEAGFVAITNVVTTSILLSLLLIISKGLWLPILVHFIWNMIGRFMGIVSLASDYPSSFNATISGNKLMSGVVAGIEGSIIVTFVNVFIILVLIMYLVKFNKKINYRQ